MAGNRLLDMFGPAAQEAQANLLAKYLGLPAGGLRRSVIDDVTGKPVITSAPTGEVVSRSNLLPLGITDEGRMTVALPQAVLGAYDAARFPGQVLRDEKGVFDPATGHVSQEAMDAANGIAGIAMTGGLGGAAVRQGETALGSGPIRAYHGSPHDFDKFSLSKIGTGEGAQAYGHGLYFAGDEAVARSYRDALAPYGGGASTKDSAARWLQRYDGNADAARAELRGQMDQAYRRGDMEAVDGLRAINGQLYAKPQSLIGHMYEVGIEADPTKMLNWDASLASQPRIRDLAGDMGARLRSDATGGDAYAAIRDRSPIPGSDLGGLIEPEFGSSAMAAQRLQEAGIPGIRYLDGNSRGAGGGSHNYVTFSDDIVNILRKYGLAGMIGGGAAAASMMQPGEAQANQLQPFLAPRAQ